VSFANVVFAPVPRFVPRLPSAGARRAVAKEAGRVSFANVLLGEPGPDDGGEAGADGVEEVRKSSDAEFDRFVSAAAASASESDEHEQEPVRKAAARALQADFVEACARAYEIGQALQEVGELEPA
jgi:hypothetical protein